MVVTHFTDFTPSPPGGGLCGGVGGGGSGGGGRGGRGGGGGGVIGRERGGGGGREILQFDGFQFIGQWNLHPNRRKTQPPTMLDSKFVHISLKVCYQWGGGEARTAGRER